MNKKALKDRTNLRKTFDIYEVQSLIKWISTLPDDVKKRIKSGQNRLYFEYIETRIRAKIVAHLTEWRGNPSPGWKVIPDYNHDITNYDS